MKLNTVIIAIVGGVSAAATTPCKTEPGTATTTRTTTTTTIAKTHTLCPTPVIVTSVVDVTTTVEFKPKVKTILTETVTITTTPTVTETLRVTSTPPCAEQTARATLSVKTTSCSGTSLQTPKTPLPKTTSCSKNGPAPTVAPTVKKEDRDPKPTTKPLCNRTKSAQKSTPDHNPSLNSTILGNVAVSSNTTLLGNEKGTAIVNGTSLVNGTDTGNSNKNGTEEKSNTQNPEAINKDTKSSSSDAKALFTSAGLAVTLLLFANLG